MSNEALHTLRIGSAHDNDAMIANDPSVSRHHAQLLFHENDSDWILEDVGSTNGTFVNEVRIMRKRIGASDSIRFGESKGYSLSDLLHEALIYEQEFKMLKRVYQAYAENKIMIQSTRFFRSRLLQTIPFVLPGVLGICISFWGVGGIGLMAASLAATLLIPLLGFYFGAKQSAQIPRQLSDLTEQFKIDYVCPKCGTFLSDIPWESLRKRGRCVNPTCKAKWGQSLSHK